MTRSLLLGALCVTAIACAPNTPIRRSALAPAPTLPSRTGLPLEEGEIRVTGEVNPVRLRDFGDFNVPDVGSPGLYVPQVQLGGSIYGSPSQGLEIGAQIRYAHLDWSERNAVGVLPFPDDGEDVFSGGLGIRGSIPIAERLTYDITLELSIMEVAQAVFLCLDCIDGGVGTYTFERYDSAIFFAPAFATGMSYRINDYVGVFGTFGAQVAVTNIGFDDDLSRLKEDTLEAQPVFPVGAGVELTLGPFVASATAFYPFEFVRDLDYGPSLSLRMGARF